MDHLKLGIAFVAMMSTYAMAARDFSDVEVKASNVGGQVYILEGAGGNIGVLATDSGLVMVDDQFEPLAEKIEAAMKSVKDVPLKYIVNTHYHGDHTGSNAHFAKHAPIFAHTNVRKRVAEDNQKPAADLPVVTYEQGVTIYLDNEEIQLRHLPSGHTDGDSLVYFKKSNVLHMGDLLFQGRFPYIDLNGGGSVRGYLKNIIKVSKEYPADITIIPGHGKVTNMKGVQDVIAMMEFSIASVEASLAKGLTEQEIVKQGLGDKYKGWSWQFINEERWLKTLVSDLK